MAYYDNAPKKKTRTNYGELGSWDEEGSHYTDRKASGRQGDRKNERSSGRYRKDDYRNATGGERGNGEGNRGDRRATGSWNGDSRRNGSDGQRTREFGRRSGGRRPEEFGPRSQDSRRQEGFDSRSTLNSGGYRQYEYRGKNAEENGRKNDFLEPERPERTGREAEEADDHILCGRNPIREALRSGREIEKLLVQKGELSGSAREIVMEAREKKIMVQEVEKHRLDEIALHHQGLIAFASAYQYSSIDEILMAAKDKEEAPFLILLDGVTDPHNLGAIIRTAECVGAHGVIIPIHRSVGLTPAAVKASAGAIEHIRVARVTNLNRTIEDLKKQGIWTYAVTMNGKDYEKVDFRGPCALVIGAEGEGISRLTEEKCDLSVKLPMKGALDSLNASVAAGVMMYRVLSCRRNG